MKQSTLTRLWIEYCETRDRLVAEGRVAPYEPQTLVPDGSSKRVKANAPCSPEQLASWRQRRDGAAPERGRDRPSGNDERS